MSSAEKQPVQVLIIEDSKFDALSLTRVLQDPNEKEYEIHHAKTLEEALRAIDKQTFDIAFLDRTLPDATDFNGLHRIQNLAPKLSIIFLTGYQDEKTAFSAIRQGAQDYLFKDRYDRLSVRRSIHYAILRKEFECELIERANYDMLTGLANRSLFEGSLRNALSRLHRHSKGVAVFFLDLDGFKQVNDTYGHLAGDKVLTEVGKRIRTSLRPHDIAARFGGDEFAFLIENIEEQDYASIIAEKIIKLCDEPMIVSGHEIKIGMSIGIAECRSDLPVDAETLIQQADQAMYEAKAVAGNAFRFCGSTPENHTRA